MKLPAMCVAGLPLLLLLSGCTHKTNQAQVQQPALAPPIVDTPPPKTETPPDLPPPVVTTPKPAQPETAANTQPPPPKPRHKKPAAKPPEQNAQPAQTASNGTGGPSESAIGQLSTGDPGDMRTQTQDSIDSIEKSLHDIGRKLSDQEQKTADQIEEYLKEAKKALTTGDVDGAHTLAAKAKVLLDELTK